MKLFLFNFYSIKIFANLIFYGLIYILKILNKYKYYSDYGNRIVSVTS